MSHIPCEECKANGTPGWLGNVGRLTKCQCLLDYEEKMRIQQRIEDSGLNKNYLDYDISNYIIKYPESEKTIQTVKNIIEGINKFIEAGGQLYAWGARNTQKTSVISYLVKQVALKNIPIYYTTMPEIINVLMQAQEYQNLDSKLEASSIKRKLETVNLLVVDTAFDPGKIYFSGKSTYKATLLSELFSYRNEQRLSNIFVANVPRDKIEMDHFGEVLPELLNRECIELQFKDKLNENEMRSNVLKAMMA